MREVVIISAWHRTRYLQQCFDALVNARGIEDKLIWVFQNRRQEPGIDLTPADKMIAENCQRFPHFEIADSIWPSWQASHNYIWFHVWMSGAPRAYFFSDDVICTPDFFEWHDAVQADGDWLGSTAWRHPAGNTKPADPAAYYQIEFPNEISMGLCVGPEGIRRLFDGWPTQKQLISEKWKIVMPYVPRCYHIGGFSSNLDSVGENTGPAVDVLPNPIPDYGRQKVVLRP
jgi:hypothetical protein